MHREIGYLPEQPYFYDYLTARELLDYYARFSSYSASERRERVKKNPGASWGCGAAGDVQLRKFSKGMLQRVGIAQAILHDPPVVILDEPMSGLDPVGRREVRDIILDLEDRGGPFFSRRIFFRTPKCCATGWPCWRAANCKESARREEIVTMEVQAMEILFEARAGARCRAALAGSRATQTATAHADQVPEEELYSVLEQLRGCEARIFRSRRFIPPSRTIFSSSSARTSTQARARRRFRGERDDWSPWR